MDLAEMYATSQEPDAVWRWHDDAVAYRELIDKMLQFPKPIIAAVNGPVVAGGAGLLFQVNDDLSKGFNAWLGGTFGAGSLMLYRQPMQALWSSPPDSWHYDEDLLIRAQTRADGKQSLPDEGRGKQKGRPQILGQDNELRADHARRHPARHHP
mgnify:CR=1 FL=1